MIQDMLFMQLRHMMETEAVNAGERAAGKPLPGARQVTVAFADLVGFTQLGEVVSAEELGHLAGRLAGLARDLTAPPVWFIKTIGDAVMLVCPDPAPLLDTVLKLVEVVDTDNNFPRLRAGVASGMAVSRAGDWFGSPVNVASRVTGVARPGAVLVADSVREALGDAPEADGFQWSFAGPVASGESGVTSGFFESGEGPLAPAPAARPKTTIWPARHRRQAHRYTWADPA